MKTILLLSVIVGLVSPAPAKEDDDSRSSFQASDGGLQYKLLQAQAVVPKVLSEPLQNILDDRQNEYLERLFKREISTVGFDFERIPIFGGFFERLSYSKEFVLRSGYFRAGIFGNRGFFREFPGQKENDPAVYTFGFGSSRSKFSDFTSRSRSTKGIMVNAQFDPERLVKHFIYKIW